MNCLPPSTCTVARMRWCRMRTHSLGESATPACSCDRSPVNTNKLNTSLFVHACSMRAACVRIGVLLTTSHWLIIIVSKFFGFKDLAVPVSSQSQELLKYRQVTHLSPVWDLLLPLDTRQKGPTTYSGV